MLHEYTGEDKWIASLDSYFDYYIPWWRERTPRSTPPWPAKVYDPNVRLELSSSVPGRSWPPTPTTESRGISALLTSA